MTKTQENKIKGCGKPLSNPFFVHWKCGENGLYCDKCKTSQGSRTNGN